VGADEVVVDEAQIVQEVRELALRREGVAILDSAPRKHGRGGSHRKSELDVVARVEPTAGEVAPDVGPVLHRRVAAPGDAAPRRLGPGNLGLVEEQGLLERLCVVEGLREKARDARRQYRRRHQDDGERTKMFCSTHSKPPAWVLQSECDRMRA
jgi:hypothetical protein